MVKETLCTEKRIMDAAKKVFHEKGFEGARMQEIADEAGINKALLHYYYRNKENLFHDVFRDALQEIFAKLFAIAGKEDSFEEKIHSIFNDYISFLQKNSYIPGFILAELRQNPERLTEVFKEAKISPIKLFEKMKESVKDDSIRDIDHRQFIINILSLCIFPIVARPIIQSIFELSGKEYDQFIEKRKELLPEFFMNAIRKS
jgi:TetR/AcrR family transcriptional regulator